MSIRQLSEVSFAAGGFISGLDHPEGITWGPDGYAYAGGELGQIYRIDIKKGSFEQVGFSQGFIGGVACDAEAGVYACNAGARRVVRVNKDGSVDPISGGTSKLAMQTPNYPCFHPSGDLYVSDSGGWKKNDGRIFRIRPNGATELWSTAPSEFANGLCLSLDARWLYVVESTLPGVSRIEIKSDGRAGARQVVATLPETVPDGVQFDEAGDFYITLYAPSRIYRMKPSGKIDVLVEDPENTILAAPTNIVFGGSDRRDLLIASLGRWHISRLRMDVPGAPLHYPARIAGSPAPRRRPTGKKAR